MSGYMTIPSLPENLDKYVDGKRFTIPNIYAEALAASNSGKPLLQSLRCSYAGFPCKINIVGIIGPIEIADHEVISVGATVNNSESINIEIQDDDSVKVNVPWS